MAETALIYNPFAGRSAATILPLPFTVLDPDEWLNMTRARLRRGLGQAPAEFRVTTLEETGRAARDAVAGGARLIVAAGGDGTIRAVAENIVGSEATLGILPRGTANVLARELGIPLYDAEKAVDVCVTGRTKRLDLGVSGERHFLLMCSVGFDAEAVKTVNPDLKGVFGASAYVLSGIANLANYTPARYTYRIDSEPERATEAFMIVIANAASYGGDYKIAPDVDMEDGLLDVFVFEAPSTLPAARTAVFLRQLGAMALGRLSHDPDVHHMCGRRVAIRSDHEAAVQIDGDACGTTPVMVEVAPQALRVRVPYPGP